MEIPALACPQTVLIEVMPNADAEKTIRRLVCAVTGTARPLVMPLTGVPMGTVPLSAGRLTKAPGTGENVLFTIAELYSWAVITREVPARESAAVVLKKAATEVTIPLRGMENAKLARSDKSMDPRRKAPGALTPKATSPTVPGAPPATVVRVTGVPEANGMIAEEPAGPAVPAGPLGPIGPRGPGGPAGPGSPVNP